MTRLDLYSALLKVLAVLALILVNGFFVAAELALVRIRATQLDALATKGHRRARIARGIVANLDAYIGATQLGITLASLGVGVAVAPVFNRLLTPLFGLLHISSAAEERTISVAIGFFINSFMLIVVGELVPKGIAIRRTLATTLFVARPLRWFYRISFPMIWLLNHSSRAMLTMLGIDVSGTGHRAHSEEELRLLLAASQQRSGGTTFGRGLVLNALDLRHRIAREVMRPRQEVNALSTEASIAECIAVAEQTRYSRFPLCEAGDLDRTLGVVHIKDLYAMRLRARSGADLQPVARKLIYVPETARLEALLQMFLERKLHMAVVVDEYGGTLGIVTLENILEELVGQIQDEFDQEVPLLVRVGEGTWEAAGTLLLHELAELLGEPLHAEGVTTVSGWVTERLGGFPRAGDTLTVGGYELRVEQSDGMRVNRLKITRRATEEPAEVPQI